VSIRLTETVTERVALPQKAWYLRGNGHGTAHGRRHQNEKVSHLFSGPMLEMSGRPGPGQDYDRSPSLEPKPPWDAGPPDGAVNMADVLAVLAQVGLACSGP